MNGVFYFTVRINAYTRIATRLDYVFDATRLDCKRMSKLTRAYFSLFILFVLYISSGEVSITLFRQSTSQPPINIYSYYEQPFISLFFFYR